MRVVREVVDVKDGLWVRDVILRKVRIKTRPWCPDTQTVVSRVNQRFRSGLNVLSIHLKSGIPLAVLIPAPATTTMFLTRPSFTSRPIVSKAPRGTELPVGEERTTLVLGDELW